MLANEFQNDYDSRALTLNTPDHYIVGYCPRYLLSNIFDILTKDPQLVEVKVERINQLPTPLNYRLLCKMIYFTLDDVKPFSHEEYQPIAREKSTIL